MMNRNNSVDLDEQNAGGSDNGSKDGEPEPSPEGGVPKVDAQQAMTPAEHPSQTDLWESSHYAAAPEDVLTAAVTARNNNNFPSSSSSSNSRQFQYMRADPPSLTKTPKTPLVSQTQLVEGQHSACDSGKKPNSIGYHRAPSAL